MQVPTGQRTDSGLVSERTVEEAVVEYMLGNVRVYGGQRVVEQGNVAVLVRDAG